MKIVIDNNKIIKIMLASSAFYIILSLNIWTPGYCDKYRNRNNTVYNVVVFYNSDLQDLPKFSKY